MLRSSLRFFAVLFPMLVLCTGCLAVGQSFDLASVIVTLVASGSASVAIAAIDRRDSVVSGFKSPAYAGKLRGGYGNPFDVLVRGRLPLAQVTADAVAKGLQAKGFNARTIALEAKADESAAKAGLKAAGAAKLLLIDIRKWESDTYMRVAMHYLLKAQVLDQAGNLLAEASVTGGQGGMDNLKGSFWNPGGYAKKAVPKAFRDQLERLLNAEAIVKGLS